MLEISPTHFNNVILCIYTLPKLSDDAICCQKYTSALSLHESMNMQRTWQTLIVQRLRPELAAHLIPITKTVFSPNDICTIQGEYTSSVCHEFAYKFCGEQTGVETRRGRFVRLFGKFAFVDGPKPRLLVVLIYGFRFIKI